MARTFSPLVFDPFPNEDWDAATPSELKEAVISIQKLAEDGFWRVDTLLEKEESAKQTLYGWLCFGLCYEERLKEAKRATREIFESFKPIAMSNRTLINGSPTAWTFGQTHALLSQHFGTNHSVQKFSTIKRWIREFCDGKNTNGVLAIKSTDEFEKWLFQENWQAPNWLQAWGLKYFGNNPGAWDRLNQQTALQRLSEEETAKLLDGISAWFWSAINSALEDIARLASISLASQGAQNTRSEDHQVDESVQGKQNGEPLTPVADTPFSKGVREGKTVELLRGQLKTIRRLYREKGWSPTQIRRATEQELAVVWEWIDRIDDVSERSEFLRVSDWDDGDGFIFRQIATLYRHAPHLTKKPTWSTLRDWRKAFRGYQQHGTPDGLKPHT